MINPFFKDLSLNDEPAWVVFTHGVVKGPSITKKTGFSAAGHRKAIKPVI